MRADRRFVVLLFVLLGACAADPVVSPDMQRVQGRLPVDFGGSWERDYSRGDEVSARLRSIYQQLNRMNQDPAYGRNPAPGPSHRDLTTLVDLARLAELITRSDVLTITQTDNEIRVDRKDDFSMLCQFYDGAAKGTDSPYGRETCGWDGEQLVSHLALPDGLQITHRFTMSADSQNLRVITTISSGTTRMPFSLRRFYKKFERPAPDYNCIETLSMKRVCSTTDIDL